MFDTWIPFLQLLLALGTMPQRVGVPDSVYASIEYLYKYQLQNPQIF